MIFPIGAVIEDDKGRYKILEFTKQKNFLHVYRVEVLQEKIPIPEDIKQINGDTHFLVVLPQNLKNIIRIE